MDTAQLPTDRIDVRPLVIAGCYTFVAAHGEAHWGEVRPVPAAMHFPLVTDCSGSAQLIFRNGGAPDIMGLGYNGEANTQICGNYQRARKSQIAAGQTRAGDVAIMNLDLAMSTQHMVVIVKGALDGHTDPIVMSHGGPPGTPPAFYPLSNDTRTKTFFRPSTMGPPAVNLNKPPASLVVARGLVALGGGGDVTLARVHGWPVYYFSVMGFHPTSAGVPKTATFYASKNFAQINRG